MSDPADRLDLVAHLRQQIEAGTYANPKRTQLALELMLELMLEAEADENPYQDEV